MTLPKTLNLNGWKPEFEGCGERLTLVMRSSKNAPKGGQVWTGSLRLDVDRYFVLQLCGAIAAMQTADRRRLEAELARLSREVAPLMTTTTTEGKS